MKPLPRSFFLADPVEVAPRLLGKWIVRRWRGRDLAARILETEAYRGLDDPAAHASHGLTPRTAILYGPPGFAYIYLVYGLHLCLNVSTLPDRTPGGVLFRAAGAFRGPGRLTAGLHIGMPLNGCDLTRRGPLYLADDGAPPPQFATSTRIGIRHATHLPYRFLVAGATVGGEADHREARGEAPIGRRQP